MHKISRLSDLTNTDIFPKGGLRQTAADFQDILQVEQNAAYGAYPDYSEEELFQYAVKNFEQRAKVYSENAERMRKVIRQSKNFDEYYENYMREFGGVV